MRAEVASQTPLGRQIKETITTGQLVDDNTTSQLVTQALVSNPKTVILDGFPRSVTQAQFLMSHLRAEKAELTVMHIMLREDVIIRKLLGRRICNTCKGNFNIEDVMEDGFDMPAILPNVSKCSMGSACEVDLVPRADDTEAAIAQRLADYHRNIGPLLSYYQEQGVLREFNVKKGIKDTDSLLEILTS